MAQQGFENGIVRVQLNVCLRCVCTPSPHCMQGSCKSCSKSSITLKSGVESMLMHYVPEVLGVESLEDEVFAEVEKRIEGKAD